MWKKLLIYLVHFKKNCHYLENHTTFSPMKLFLSGGYRAHLPKSIAQSWYFWDTLYIYPAFSAFPIVICWVLRD